MATKVQTEMRIQGWNSGYASIDNVLRHLQRKSSGYGTPSYSSVTAYSEVLAWFCRFSGKNPDELVALERPEVEELIHSYLDSLVARGLSKNTVKKCRSYLLLHFSKNGFKREKQIEIETYHVPARYRRRLEYIPSSEEVLAMADAALSLRDRAMILCLYTSGLRHHTFLSLRYKDVKAELGNDIMLVPVYPEMKKVDPKACKNNVPYYTFFDPIASDALKALLRNRESKFGAIGDEELLFYPDPQRVGIPRDAAKFKVINKNELNGHVLKQAAKNAHIAEWKNIHAHCLRKSFEEAVRRRRPDGSMMGEKDQRFILGHILPGSEDPYYGSGVRIKDSAISFDKEVAYKLREEYRMVQFFPSRQLVTTSQMDAQVKKEMLMMFSDLNEKEIAELGDLSNYSREQIKELARGKEFERLGLKGKSTQKIIPFGELREAIMEGWELVQRLDDSKEAIVRLPK